MTMPMIVAHRGGAGLRPENTLAACARALGTGADGIEIDVRLSREGEVIVFHDAVPDPRHVRAEGGRRLSGEPPRVRELSLHELRMFDVGYPRAEGAAPVPGECIPSLGELLGFLNGQSRKPLLLIELKTDFDTASPLDPAGLTDAVLAVLAAQAGETPFRLMSFDWRCLTHAMNSLSAERCVFLTAPGYGESGAGAGDAPWFAGHPPARYGGSAVQAISALGGRHWGPHHAGLEAHSVIEAHEAGIKVAAWTVNEPRHLMRMQAFGVDYIVTDYPDRAMTVRNMARRHHGARPDTEPESRRKG
ncbi:MAG: glycerophosphodiester phosphodiesterase [bacterium]